MDYEKARSRDGAYGLCALIDCSANRRQTNQNTQEVKYERLLLWTRQTNVHIFGMCVAFNKTIHGQMNIKYVNDEN